MCESLDTMIEDLENEGFIVLNPAKQSAEDMLRIVNEYKDSDPCSGIACNDCYGQACEHSR